MDLEIPSGCGNAPRKRFLVDFNAAFAKGRMQEILAGVTDDVVWDVVGEHRLEGKAAFRRYLESLPKPEAKALRLYRVITHGRDAAVDGALETGSGAVMRFCDVYTFKDTKNNLIRSIHSYAIAD